MGAAQGEGVGGSLGVASREVRGGGSTCGSWCPPEIRPGLNWRWQPERAARLNWHGKGLVQLVSFVSSTALQRQNGTARRSVDGTVIVDRVADDCDADFNDESGKKHTRK